MPCSPEQRAANKKNAQRSTGPVTLEGKIMSRKNGYKHGLTGEGVVLSDEEAGLVEERFDLFEADLKPANDVARVLAHRAAYLTVRMERGAREDSARINRAMLQANEVEEDARRAELERLVLMIMQEPAEAIRKLRLSPEGIDRLIGGWQDQKATLLNPSSSIGTGNVLYYLMGRHPVNSQSCRMTVLIRALGFNFTWMSETDWPDLPDHERKEMARGELAELIDREIEGLRMARAALDHEAIAKVRAGAARRAIVDTTKAGVLARKYEAADERNLHKALDQIAAINAEALEEAREAAKPEAKASEETACDELGSSLPGAPETPQGVESVEVWARRGAGVARNRAERRRNGVKSGAPRG